MGSRVFIVAGEASADVHAAALLRELKKQDPEISAYGVGGQNLRQEGMELICDARSLNVVGFGDWWGKASEVLRSYRGVIKSLRASPPDLAILLDLPDFNLMLARKLKAQGVPVAYYISPQVWAWRRYRVKKIKKYVDKMLVVFPFEQEFYRNHGVAVDFVGHPLLDSIKAREQHRDAAEISAGQRLAILPGSRESEIRYHAPILSQTIAWLRADFPKMQIRVPVAPTLDRALLKQALGEGVDCNSDDSHEVLRWADAALVASGTATLETALIGTPHCIFYRASRLFVFVVRRCAGYRNFIGMPNLLAGREIVREFVQEKVTAANLYQECRLLLQDASYRSSVKRGLAQCRSHLGEAGASERAARSIVRLLKEKKDFRYGTSTLVPQPQ